MDDVIRDGARLSIADAIQADREDELEAIDIHMIFTLRRDRSVRQWFRCPSRECTDGVQCFTLPDVASSAWRALGR
jgi:hypothetical protein